MLLRIVERSLVRRRRRKLLSLLAVTLGLTVATVVATLSLDVGDKVNRELRSFGANITVMPAADSLPLTIGGVDYRPAGSGAFLEEANLAALKKIFWSNNILAFAPFLFAPATVEGRSVVLIGTWFDKTIPVGDKETFRTGLRDLHPTWQVEGGWPSDEGSACLVGQRLARALHVARGGTLHVELGGSSQGLAQNAAAAAADLSVGGILETGGPDDGQVIVPLAVLQKLTGEEGKVRRVEVSALTKPEDDFARQDPAHLSPSDYERWSCTPYVRSIASQIEQAIPGADARPVFPVAETEGKILDRIGVLMALLAAAALVTAGLAMASMMFATVLERRAEIALYKSLGATPARVAAVFLVEASTVGLLGGALGYFAGNLLARRLSTAVFGSAPSLHWVLLPVVLALALIVTWLGSALPLARGLRVPAATALRQ